MSSQDDPDVAAGLSYIVFRTLSNYNLAIAPFSSAKDFTEEQLGTPGNAGTNEICDHKERFVLRDSANVRVGELMDEYMADKEPLPDKRLGTKADGTRWGFAVLQDGSQVCEVQVHRWRISAAEFNGLGDLLYRRSKIFAESASKYCD
ncbi:MAG: hypothetical protein Q9174_002819 [Haloplaca sp. 1 TL-2023]